MNADVDYLINILSGHSRRNQIILLCNGQISKVERRDYFPDNLGNLRFNYLLNWSLTGYSVAEMLEFLQKYQGLISSIEFRFRDNKTYSLLNASESDVYGDYGDYSSVLEIGEAGLPMNLEARVPEERTLWGVSGLLYADKFLR